MSLKKTITILFLFCCSNLFGQYVFTNFQKNNGLSSNEVFCSFKDDEGIIWFGTSRGLDRYDGSGFKLYNRSKNDTIAAATMVVTAIGKKNNTELWIGTVNGLFIFDKRSGTFIPVAMIDRQKKQLNNCGVYKLIADHQNRTWIVSTSGLFIIKDEKAVPASFVYPSCSVVPNTNVPGSTMIDDLLDGLWTGTGAGLFFIDFKSGNTWSLENNPHKLTLFEKGTWYALCPGENGDIWFSNDKYSLGRYERNTNRVINITAWSQAMKNAGLFLDSKKRLWLNNYSGKIYVLDTNGKFIRLPDDSPENYKPCNVMSSSITEDDEHNIWLTGVNGISKLKVDSYLQNIIIMPDHAVNNQYAHSEINRIVDAGNDKLWVCKDDGLYLLDPATGDSKRYAINNEGGKPNRFFDVDLINGEWWGGTGDGIKILDPGSSRFRSFEYYAKEFPVKNVAAYWIHQDKKGMIWFAIWNTAVFRFDPVTKKTIRVEEIRSTDLSNPILTNSLCVLENSDGKMWFGNGYKGVIIFDNKTGRFTTPASIGSQTILRICRDSNSNVWLAAKDLGILKADKDGNLLDSIPVPAINNIGFDEQGGLWVSGSDGLQYVNTEKKTMSFLPVDMGAPFHDLSGTIFLSNGKLYGSVMNKLAIIDPAAADDIAVTSSPVISGLKVFEKEVPYTTLNPGLDLRYNENFFSIEFSSVKHAEIISLKYAYKLEGFDKDWIYCGRRQIASYTNVPDGHYTFRVKSTDANGQWMEKETVVDITIKPPFWKTAWFIAAVLLLLAATAFYLYRLNRRRRQKKYIDNTIDYFANSVYGHNSVNEICWDIARNCISQLHFEDCVVYLFDEHKNKLVQVAAYGPKNPKGHEIINPIEIGLGTGIVGTAALTAKPLLIADTTKDERYILDDAQRNSELAVPIIHDNKVIGVIDSEHSRKNFFNEGHIKALHTIAAISANKIAEAMAESKAKEKEIALLEINKMLAESQLMALRAQMNPHFVFNCLNSIQECIVTEKYGEASKYLNKFSKLFRMVLNNSGKKLVTIQEEKEVLELYLELEQMRFEQSFEYDLIVDDDLLQDEVLIPSMLVQPFVENALWHGLMHKSGERKLRVEFRRKGEELFECIIEDNGIGRQRSFALKQEQSKAKHHESKGLAICKDRLEILQKQGFHAQLLIEDRSDAKGDPAGTRVIIELSAELIN